MTSTPLPLTEHQTVPMTREMRQQLRECAADLDTSIGVLARALLLVGMNHVHDSAVTDAIAHEAQQSNERHSRAGKAAMERRWSRVRGGS